MKGDENKDRRSALKHLAATLLGLIGWNLARASTPGTEGGVFASLFLQEATSVHVPLGYYDPRTQRYCDAKTHKPIFAPDNELAAAAHRELAATAVPDQTVSGKTRLTDDKLADLLGNGRYVDVMALEKLRAFGQSCTVSQLTTLSTTQCCPIVTDSQRDTQCDDTPTASRI